MYDEFLLQPYTFVGYAVDGIGTTAPNLRDVGIA